MRVPYLIQRMSFKKNPSGDSIDGIFELDYMGSAEFEFGALPKSLKKMTKTCDDLTFEFIKSIKNYKNQGFCLIGLPGDIEDYKGFIDKLVNDDLRTKEMVKLKEAIDGKDSLGRPIEESFNKTEAWWDIDNQVMFTFGKDNARKIIKAIKAVRDKKKEEGNNEWY